MSLRIAVTAVSQALTVLFLFFCCGTNAHATEHLVTVGSKQFTESNLLGELAVIGLRAQGMGVRHQANLGGTQLLWQALQRGDIDVYPEYTGTIAEEILGGRLGSQVSIATLRQALRESGIEMTEPLGFNNSYALGMSKKRAEELQLTAISQLVQQPSLRFGFSNEFMDRGDGWGLLRERYRLPQKQVRGLEHELAYRALASGDLDVTDLYTTDPEIAYYDLRVLDDDRHHFPSYLAVFLYRDALVQGPSGAVQALHALQGRVSQQAMIAMNRRVKIDRRPEREVATEFLKSEMSITVQTDTDTWQSALWHRTGEHLWLVGVSLCAAIVVGVPMGVLCARWHRFGHLVLGVIGVLQTIPALALLVMMLPLAGIGDGSAVLAIFVYSLLPIVRNTCSGLQSIPRALLESADALGLPRYARLRLIELPLASRPVFAGVKTAAVINVGTATLGALVGAGGYGQPILTGIRLDDMPLILQGAVPAAVLAITIQYGFDLLEAWLLPRGLK